MNFKSFFLALFLLLSLISFSQEKKIIKSGYITFKSNSILEFKDLTVDAKNVTYFNDYAKTEMSFSLESIKKIVDMNGTVIYFSNNQNVVQRKVEDKKEQDSIKKIPVEKLVYKSPSKIMLKDKKLSNQEIENILIENGNVYNSFIKGKKQTVLGDVFIGGGIGFFLGGALINLSKSQTQEEIASGQKKGSPAFLIIGLATSIIGIPIKIGGVQKIKSSINSYNSSFKKVTAIFKPELKFIAGANGFGFQVGF